MLRIPKTYPKAYISSVSVMQQSGVPFPKHSQERTLLDNGLRHRGAPPAYVIYCMHTIYKAMAPGEVISYYSHLIPNIYSLYSIDSF